MLKRYASEHDTGVWKEKAKVATATGKKVAVIGAGPAGLTASYYLAKRGHSVMVFEALSDPGGMMRVGIPDYRLPKDFLKSEIDEIKNTGVEIKTNTKIESLDELFANGYNAVFLAIGAHQGIKLGVPGEDSPHVIECADFLRAVSLGKKVNIGKRVAVIGGGNAAIDAARTAKRLGAKEVVIIYRRSRDEMPASPEEIDEAIAEGMTLYPLANPTRITSRNGTADLQSVRMELGEMDESGRRRPQPVKGSEFTMTFDTIIASIGQRPDVPEKLGVAVDRGNIIKVNPDTLATNREGVFAGGDAVSGPASVIEAIAAGRRAASSIDKYLGGTGIIDETLAPMEEAFKPLEESEEKRRPEMPLLPEEERIKGFHQVELGYTDEMAIEEAGRCLRCDLEKEEE